MSVLLQDEGLRQTLGPPFMEVVMEEGDMLYIPRGWPHAARNQLVANRTHAAARNANVIAQHGSAATHLTVGVHIYVYVIRSHGAIQ
jgi:hypothetical protein